MYKLLINLFVIIFVVNVYSQVPRTAQDLNQRGLERQAAGDLDGAIADFTQAIELTSRLGTKPVSLLSRFSSEQESLEDAPMQERVRIIDPRTAIAYTNRGRAYFAKFDLERAALDLDR